MSGSARELNVVDRSLLIEETSICSRSGDEASFSCDSPSGKVPLLEEREDQTEICCLSAALDYVCVTHALISIVGDRRRGKMFSKEVVSKIQESVNNTYLKKACRRR